MAEEPQRLDRQVIYESPWVNLYVDRVALPAGRIIEQHHVLAFDKEAVAVLVENAAGALLFVEAYRYVTGTVQWEIPAGSVEPGEPVLAAAAREVWEEGGCRTADHRLLYSFHPITGIGDKVHHIVHCRAVDPGHAFDANEVRSVRWFSPQQATAMIRGRALRDGYTVTALLLFLSGLADL